MPDLEQTMGSWAERVGTDTFEYLQNVFRGETPVEKAHKYNAVILIRKGYLVPEVDDGLPPYQRQWDHTKRYSSNF